MVRLLSAHKDTKRSPLSILSHRLRLFKGAEFSPFATVAQLLAAASISRGYGDEDVRHMTSLEEPILDEKAFPGFTRRALVTLASITGTSY